MRTMGQFGIMKENKQKEEFIPMSLQRKEHNIPLMYAICFFQGIVLYASISTLYRQARGLSLSEYAVIDGFSYLFQLAFEIPFGMLADRIGYKKTLIFSNGLYLLSKIIFWKAFGFTDFLLERLFFSMALAGLSGLDVSILYLSCGKRDSQKIFSHYSAFGTAGMLTGCFLFTLFLSENYAVTAFGTVISYSIAFVLSFFVVDVKETEEKDERPSLGRLMDTLKVTVKDQKFLLFILGDAMVAYGTWAVRVFLIQNKYLSLGLTQQHMGMLDIAFSALALTAVFSAALTRKLGFRKFMVTGMGTVAVCAIIIGITGSAILAILCSAAVEVSATMLSPLINDLYSKRVTVSDRATQLSVYAMISEIISFTLSFAMSFVAAWSYTGSFLFCAVLSGMGIFLFLYCYRGVRSIDE